TGRGRGAPQIDPVTGEPVPQAAGRGRGNADPTAGQGGSRVRGIQARRPGNNSAEAQPDPKLRELDTEPTPAEPGPRQDVFCTKVGATHPEEMYIIGAHMDGIGWGEAANDDGSGTAIVMEIARVLSSPDVRTDRSIRFALWNNEESGTEGAQAYVQQRQALQGKEGPAGSGKDPEPKWLGMIPNDMTLFGDGIPLAAGRLPKEARPDAQ